MSLLVNGEILLYGTVGDPWGDGWGFSVRQVAEALSEAPSGTVVVRINSGGGNAFDGVAIHSLLKTRGAIIHIDGIAASAASLIAMAGTEIIINQGAMLMIHDPSTITWGDAAAHRKTAETLDTIAENYARVYAERSGKTQEAARDLMKAETWFGADEALAAGFATSVSAPAENAPPKASFDYDLYRAAPAALPRRAPPAQPAAKAALPKDGLPMPDPNKPAASPPATVTEPVANAEQPKGWSLDIYTAAARAGLTLAETNPIVAAAKTREEGLAGIIDAVAAKQSGTLPEANGARTVVTADGGDKFRIGVSQALMVKAGLEARDGKNEWNGASLMAIAQYIASSGGVRLASRDPFAIITAAITHTSSDFPSILENVASKAMLKGFEEADETFELWTNVGSLSDFKASRRVDLNAFGSLPRKLEGGEYESLTTGERGETVQLTTAGGVVSITREAIINDDVDAFSRIPRKLGDAARRTIGDSVYGVLTSNPNMSDGVALFHANHKNLSTAVLGIDGLNAARATMAKQKDRSATKATLNIRPAFLLTPVVLEGTALQLMNSTAEPGQANPNVANRVSKMAQVISEARLDEASATAWYLLAGKNRDTVEVQYLNGQRQPTIERDMPFLLDGVQFKVRIDYGVKGLAWETMHKSTGAGG